MTFSHAHSLNEQIMFFLKKQKRRKLPSVYFKIQKKMSFKTKLNSLRNWIFENKVVRFVFFENIQIFLSSNLRELIWTKKIFYFFNFQKMPNKFLNEATFSNFLQNFIWHVFYYFVNFKITFFHTLKFYVFWHDKMIEFLNTGKVLEFLLTCY